MEYSVFSCNITNTTTLSWEINGVGIGAFRYSYLEDVIAGDNSNYTYLASLSSILLQNLGKYSFASKLFLLAAPGSLLQVKCTSDYDYNSTSNQATPLYQVKYTPRRQGSVVVQPVVLTNSITVSNGENLNINACICSSTIASGNQTWTTDGGDYIAFDSNSDFGTLKNRLANSRDTIRLQAISLGQHQQNFVSILYWSSNSNISVVRCIAGDNRVECPINFISGTSDEGRFMYYYNLRNNVLAILRAGSINWYPVI